MSEPRIQPAGVGDGVSNPIVGGSGALVIPAITSPNFNLANPAASPNPSWAILKNGLAYFFGLVLAGGTIVGPDYILDPTGFYFYEGAPALGNLAESVVPGLASVTDPKGNTALPGVTSYFNALGSPQIASQSFAGNTIYYQWTGTTWSGSASIFADFSTGLLEIVGQNGIKITGPIVGPVPGLDIAGPIILESTVTLKNGAQLYVITTASGNAHPIFPAEIELAEAAQPSAPGSGVKVYSDTLGIPRAIGEDGSALSLGARTVMFTGTQAITLTAFTTLNDGTNNLSSNVGTGRKYKIRARVYYQAAGIIGAPAFHVTAPASQGGIAFEFDYNGNASSVARYDNASGFGSSEAGPANATVTAAVIVTLDITGTASFSAGGTVAVAASIGGAGNSGITIVQGSFLEVSPI